MPSWLPLLVPVAFVLFWCLLCCLIALAGGWRKMAQAYRAPTRPPGDYFGWQAALIGGTRYSGCITFGLTAQGLYLAVLPPFRPGHPPLLIPWAALAPGKPQKIMWVAYHPFWVSLPGPHPTRNRATVAPMSSSLAARIAARLEASDPR